MDTYYRFEKNETRGKMQKQYCKKNVSSWSDQERSKP